MYTTNTVLFFNHLKTNLISATLCIFLTIFLPLAINPSLSIAYSLDCMDITFAECVKSFPANIQIDSSISNLKVNSKQEFISKKEGLQQLLEASGAKNYSIIWANNDNFALVTHLVTPIDTPENSASIIIPTDKIVLKDFKNNIFQETESFLDSNLNTLLKNSENIKYIDIDIALELPGDLHITPRQLKNAQDKTEGTSIPLDQLIKISTENKFITLKDIKDNQDKADKASKQIYQITLPTGKFLDIKNLKKSPESKNK